MRVIQKSKVIGNPHHIGMGEILRDRRTIGEVLPSFAIRLESILTTNRTNSQAVDIHFKLAHGFSFTCGFVSLVLSSYTIHRHLQAISFGRIILPIWQTCHFGIWHGNCSDCHFGIGTRFASGPKRPLRRGPCHFGRYYGNNTAGECYCPPLPCYYLLR